MTLVLGNFNQNLVAACDYKMHANLVHNVTLNSNIDPDSRDGGFCDSWLACHPFMQRSNDFHSRNHNFAIPNPFNEHRMRDVHGEQAVRNMKHET